MKILVVAPEVLYPPRTGTGKRCLQVLVPLAKRHSVDCLALHIEGSENRPAISSDEGWGSDLANLCSIYEVFSVNQRSMTLGYGYAWYSHPFVTRLEQLATAGRYDAIVGISASAALYLKGLASGKVALILNDADEMNYRRAALHASDLRDRVRACRSVLVFQLFRRAVLSKYRHLIVVSEIDAQFLRRQFPKASVHVIPLGVEPCFMEESEGEEPGVLMFHGGLGTPHNHDAATYILKEIFPAVSRSQPNTHLWLVGPGARPSLVELASHQSNVRLVGYVPDVRPYLRRATVYLCPHETGSGMKTKLLEAWATGKAVVASPLAVGGLPVRDGQHFLLANSPADYRDAVLKLLGDQKLRISIGQNARQFVRQNFLPEPLSAQLESVLIKLSPQSRTSPDALQGVPA